ncbi:hypothetical protein C8R44DRAFT_820509, partial [Mycena epipterygia]
LSPEDTPITAGCSSQATIHVVPRLKGGKPVIYLFAPNVVDAAARFTLTRHWHLSAVYPVVQQTKSIAAGDTVEWQARVHPDGTLTECTTGLDVAYLLWAALFEPSSFSRTTCDLTPADSIRLPVDTITP